MTRGRRGGFWFWFAWAGIGVLAAFWLVVFAVGVALGD